MFGVFGQNRTSVEIFGLSRENCRVNGTSAADSRCAKGNLALYYKLHATPRNNTRILYDQNEGYTRQCTSKMSASKILWVSRHMAEHPDRV